jgi:hypothetical protein
MNASAIIRQLDALLPTIDGLIIGLDHTDARWKPPSGAWSILEIICHLIDEERDDFGARLRSTLEDPARAWPPIDPEGWARERKYNDRAFSEQLATLRTTRAQSLAWLRSVAGSDWSRAYIHPKLGPIRAGDLLGAWAAHDLLHIRQLTKRRFELLARDAEPFSIRYAGEWGA